MNKDIKHVLLILIFIIGGFVSHLFETARDLQTNKQCAALFFS